MEEIARVYRRLGIVVDLVIEMVGDKVAKFAQVGWEPDDVRAALMSVAAGRKMSDDQCEDFLALIKEDLEDRMVAAGWEVLQEKLAKYLELAASDSPQRVVRVITK